MILIIRNAIEDICIDPRNILRHAVLFHASCIISKMLSFLRIISPEQDIIYLIYDRSIFSIR